MASYIAKIYRIVNNVNAECYVGSTRQSLTKRFSEHKYAYHAKKSGRSHSASSSILFDRYGIENCSIVLVEELTVHNREELLQAERLCYERYRHLAVNQRTPGNTTKYYRKYYATLPQYRKNMCERALRRHHEISALCYLRTLFSVQVLL